MFLVPYLFNAINSFLWSGYLGTIWKYIILQIKGNFPAGSPNKNSSQWHATMCVEVCKLSQLPRNVSTFSYFLPFSLSCLFTLQIDGFE